MGVFSFSERTYLTSCPFLSTVAGPIDDCTITAIVLMVSQAVSTAASSYLFLKRVHAVYYGNNIVNHFLTFLWLVGVGTSCAVFSGTLHDYSEIADTKHCLRYQHHAQLTIAYVLPVVFDTLVYLAISYKILTSHRLGKKWCWGDFWRGRMLPDFSQAILSGGQQYYGYVEGMVLFHQYQPARSVLTCLYRITSSINITRLSQSSQYNVSPTFELLLSSLTVALTSAMACRVYRNLIIASLRDSERMPRKPFTALKSADRRGMNQTLPTSTILSVSPYSEPDGERGCSAPKGEFR